MWEWASLGENADVIFEIISIVIIKGGTSNTAKKYYIRIMGLDSDLTLDPNMGVIDLNFLQLLPSPILGGFNTAAHHGTMS